MIKRLSLTLLAATAIGVVVCQAASAADIVPRKAPPPAPPPPPIWSWTGFYFGGHFGAGWSRDQFSLTQTPTIFTNKTAGFFDEFSIPGGDFATHNGVGPLGGFQLGYNYQVPNSPWVFGIEGEFSFADLKGSSQRSFSQADTFSALNNLQCTGGEFPICEFTAISQVNATANEQLSIASRVKDLAAITARFGIASGPQDRTLWYVKGGGAWERTDYAVALSASTLACVSSVTLDTIFTNPGNVVSPTGCSAGNGSAFASGSSSRWGWTVGTGVEWGLWDNWSAKIEYDFLDFGTHGITVTDNNGNIFNFNDKQQIHEVKVGINYRFWNWGY
jgi:outer membrane immunogenic protein